MKSFFVLGLVLLLVLWGHDAVLGQGGGFGGVFSPELGRLSPRLGYELEAISEEPVSGQGTELSFVRQDFEILLPLGQDEGYESFLTADVVKFPTSDPASGSVSSMVPVHSPVNIFFKKRCFSSSLPNACTSLPAPWVSPGYIINA